MTSGTRASFGRSGAVDVSLVGRTSFSDLGIRDLRLSGGSKVIRVCLGDPGEIHIWAWRIKESSAFGKQIKESSASGKVLVPRSPSIQGVWQIKIITEVRTRCSWSLA
ncbi:unnamed protein product [Linum trigynum]|uniref:Uncharacterized protein n=1 Tax=Linum trigynum TaxID=586398 RepID=A0AAV2EBS6_9ROSI